MKKIIQTIALLILLGFSASAQNNLPLPQLPWAQTLTGSEVYPVYQNGRYCKASVAQTDSLAASLLFTGIGPNLPATDSIHLSSTQILALDSTPLMLEPGIAGHSYQILAIRMDYTFNSTAFDSTAQLYITQDNTTTGQLYYDAGFIHSTASGTTFLGRAQANGRPGAIRGDALTVYANTPITHGNGAVDLFITYLIR